MPHPDLSQDYAVHVEGLRVDLTPVDDEAATGASARRAAAPDSRLDCHGVSSSDGSAAGSRASRAESPSADASCIEGAVSGSHECLESDQAVAVVHGM
jgi:hypothetical protein